MKSFQSRQFSVLVTCLSLFHRVQCTSCRTWCLSWALTRAETKHLGSSSTSFSSTWGVWRHQTKSCPCIVCSRTPIYSDWYNEKAAYQRSTSAWRELRNMWRITTLILWWTHKASQTTSIATSDESSSKTTMSKLTFTINLDQLDCYLKVCCFGANDLCDEQCFFRILERSADHSPSLSSSTWRDQVTFFHNHKTYLLFLDVVSPSTDVS